MQKIVGEELAQRDDFLIFFFKNTECDDCLTL